jgi:hypothetical protein
LNYKYYIYKSNAGITDKYDLSKYALIREIQQNSKWGLKIETDPEWLTIKRRKFSGEITVKGVDFDTLIALERTHIQYAIVIHRECTGVYTEFWKGFFSYFDFKVGLDRCYLSFEPKVWDKYSPVFDQMDIDRNVLAASAPQTVSMRKPEFSYESITWNYITSGALPPPAAFDEYIYTPLPVPNEYYLWGRVIWEFAPATYYVYEEYRRDIGYTICGTPGCEPSGSGDWVLEGSLKDNPAIFKWVRPYLSSDWTTYTHEVKDSMIYEILIVNDVYLVPLNGCIALKSVIEYLATFFNLTYVSHFFNDTPCPMGGDTLILTMLQQISNLRVTRDFAIKADMKLRDLLIWIRDTFNCYWYIDSLGDFRIEHRKWFEWGFSYTVYGHSIELDLTTYPDNIRHMNRYEWANNELQRFEKLEIAYSYSLDWVEAGIEYPQLSILGNETKKIIVGWGTDAFSMYDSRNELPRYGWLLLDCYQQWVPKAVKVVRDTTGAISGTVFQNARFSSANLMRDLWGWGRILPTGLVNNSLTTFGSIARLKKQVPLPIPECCQDLDYNGNFRTELGDGIIDSAEYEANTGMLKVNLIYE